MTKLTLPAVRVRQPFGEFYVASVPATLLGDVTWSDVVRAEQASDEAIYSPRGVERREDVARLKAIGKFIDTSECAFPGSIILAANYAATGVLEEEDERRWQVEATLDGAFRIIIPSADRVVSIVDGQHRLRGFKYSQSQPGRLSQIELPCSIYFDLPNPFQAYLFATVNFNQKKVDRSLAYELFGFDVEDERPELWPPEKAAVFLCRKLNSEKASPFYGRIKISAPVDARAQPHEADWRVSTATIVRGILSLISRDPQGDRTYLLSAAGRRRRESLSSRDESPLRRLYLDTNDLLTYSIVSNFFCACDNLLWKNASEGAFIKRTVGIQALFDVLRDIAPFVLKDKKASTDYFASLLAPAAKVDFSDAFFRVPSGVGRTRIRKLLQFALGRIGETELGEGVSEYKRILKSAEFAGH